jgi:hypothetical protein
LKSLVILAAVKKIQRWYKKILNKRFLKQKQASLVVIARLKIIKSELSKYIIQNGDMRD